MALETLKPGDQKLRLLIVDDDAVDRDHVARLLAKAGAHVETEMADSVASAMNYASTHEFDCVVLDYMLPEGPCTEILLTIMGTFADAAVIVLTGQGDEAVAVHIMKLGASDYLSKEGLDETTLWRAIRNACALQLARKEFAVAAKKSRNHAAQLRAMVTASPKLARAHDLTELVALAADSAREVLGVSTAFVSMESGSGTSYHLSISAGTPPSIARSATWCVVRMLACAAGGVQRHVLDCGEEVTVIGLGDRAGRNVGCIGVPSAADPLANDNTESLLLAFAQIVCVTRDNLDLYLTAKQAVQARDDVLAVVSHDLRAPLGNMVLGLSLLKDGMAASEQKILGRIERSVHHMGHLVDELVDMVRVEGRRLDVAVKYHVLKEIVDTSMALVAPAADAAGVQCTAALDPKIHNVRADKHRVVQVLSNLMGNGVKFTPKGGSVRLSVEKRENDVLFCISDTGPGISEGQLESIFKRFWRSDTGHQKGLGLGLFIAKGIVDAHGGRIWCESKAGEGAKFLFTLPDSSAPATRSILVREGATAHLTDTGTDSSNALTAMVADDDDDARALMSRALQRAGFTVLQLRNGVDLVEAFRTQDPRPSLVVSDIGMPELDGIEAVTRIRAMSQRQPILMVTAFTDHATLKRAQSAGADRVLYKPLNLAAFVNAAVACVGPRE